VPGCYAWRNNTGTAVIRGRFVKFGDLGSADIIACVCGRFIAIECKVGRGKQSEPQQRWQAKIETAGGYYFVVRSVADVVLALEVVR